MRRLFAIALALTLGGLVAVVAHAETFKLTDGSSVEGNIVSATEGGVVVRLADGSYSARVAWDKLTQEDLQRLAKNSKYGRYVEGLVLEEEPPEARKPAKPAIPNPKPVETKLDRPEKPALIGGFFGSALGWLVILALYAANLWAAYEIAVFRARPVGLVCGLAAVVPVIPQIVFLSLPMRLPKPEAAPGEEGAAGAAVAEPEQKFGAGLKIAQEAAHAEEATKAAEPTIFKRGEFMFNRRFFETRFTNFFTLVRRDKDKGTVLVIKTSRTAYTANRISRITANDLHIEVAKGAATEEVSISFVEIQEVQLRQGGAR